MARARATKKKRVGTGPGRKVSVETFTLSGIRNLRRKDEKGIHVVFSGFNAAFREYFGKDPVAAMKELEAEGVIVIKPAMRGVIIYDPADVPELAAKLKSQQQGSATLAKILG